jgi:hypothetical protein
MAEHRSFDRRGSNPSEPTRKQGGMSGTGQAFPHHGFGDEDSAAQAMADPAEIQAQQASENGETYQAGGSHLNRLRQEETRKQRLSGSTVASAGRGGLDPAPGAPVRRG